MQRRGVFVKDFATDFHVPQIDERILVTEVLDSTMISYGDNAATFSIHRFALSCVGIWPLKEKSFFMDLRWIIAVFLETMPLCVYFGEIYLHCNGAKKAFDSLTPGSAAALALVRLVTSRIHRLELLEIITSMINDWTTQQDQRICWIMRKYAKLSKRVTILTFILVGIIVAVYISIAISAVIGRRGGIDREIDNASDRTENEIQSCVFRGPSSHKAFMIIQAMQMLVTGVLTFGTTSFFFGLAMHLCAQFDVLSIRLSEFSVREFGEARHAISEAIRRHCHLIHLVDCMEETFNASILMYLFVTTTLMCIDGFMLIVSLQLGNLSMIIHSCSVLLLMMIQLSFYTFAGDRLEMRSTTLSYAAYDSDWYDLPANMAKDIRFILMRTNIPHQLTAGKFVPMNMVTFKDILKSTASYLSVLRIMLDE